MGQQISTALLQSIHRIILVLVRFLPGVLAFLLAVIIFALIGAGLAALVRRLLTALHFDDRLAAHEAAGSPAQLADLSPARSPSLLLSRAAFWLCILAGLAIGISAFDASYASDSHVSAFLLPYLTHITGAVILLFVGNLIARFLSLGIKWLVLVLTAAMALDHLGIGGTVVELAFGILFGGIVLTLSLAVGLGSRDLVTRSLEKSMDLPPRPGPTEVPPPAESPTRLRHF
jgi:hypothetical protein